MDVREQGKPGPEICSEYVIQREQNSESSSTRLLVCVRVETEGWVRETQVKERMKEEVPVVSGREVRAGTQERA